MNKPLRWAGAGGLVPISHGFWGSKAGGYTVGSNALWVMVTWVQNDKQSPVKTSPSGNVIDGRKK